MKIYYKILLTLLPIGLLIVILMGLIHSHFTSKALTTLATTWLETRLSEAIHIAEQQDQNLKSYDLEGIPASVLKAQMDAEKQIRTIGVGKEGYIFAVDKQGHIVFNPNSSLVGYNVSDESWFQQLKEKRGTLTYRSDQGYNLAFYGYFEPWQWFIIATDPQKEFFGAAQRIKPLIWITGLLGAIAMAVALMILTHGLTRPLKSLTEGTRRVGEGDLKTNIEVTSKDELGQLARNFNRMTQRLQEITVLRNELEEAVRKRTAELMEMNKRLVKTERFAAAGQLATTVAHEINSPLQGIFSLVELMKDDVPQESESLEELESIETGLQSIKKTVKNLMDLNRPSGLEKSHINLNRVISNTFSLFNTQVAKVGGTIQLDLEPNMPYIFASSQLLSHVFINLINNSMEAMADDNVHETEKPRNLEIKIQTRCHRKRIVIKFQDNGPGIKEDVLPNLFVPFFTTKKKLGMGVGLTICSDSIHEHGGLLEAANAPHGGALFTITLPTDNTPLCDHDPPAQAEKKQQA
ncbi:His Kinase A (phospho-acceptor) domain-containing protein [Desulfocicer vacuolatum DSM 3385]|uniref:histidine kinase n=1 Tax=Desulfocicer vacuolatum DSM 3385 TaxID=1121400 RepID=A0A1W2DWN8_9BACT|nr:ATP-binding protein [Desulfocicer vacuolatum]SMD01941.1 His Kinase A (phospho-acceptor) domain-containing protein [Desulfocicer vacuolatum DSM 3385]